MCSLPGLDGDYFRLLLPGTYTVTASASGYIPSTSTVTVGPAEAIQVCFLNECVRMRNNETSSFTYKFTFFSRKGTWKGGQIHFPFGWLEMCSSVHVLHFFLGSFIFTWKRHRNKIWKSRPTMARGTSHLPRLPWNWALDETWTIISTPHKQIPYKLTHTCKLWK